MDDWCIIDGWWMDGRCMMMDGWWIDNGWMDDVWIMDGWMIDGWLMDEWLMDGYIHYGWWLDGWLKGDGWMMDGCLVKGLMDEWMDAWWIHDGWMDDDHTGWHNPSWHMHFFMWHLPQNRSSLFCILFPFLYRKWYIYNACFFQLQSAPQSLNDRTLSVQRLPCRAR